MIRSLDGDNVIWTPLPKQALAMACPALELMLGGSKGIGKTDFLVTCWTPLLNLAHTKFQQTGRLQKKCRIAIFRNNVKDLQDIIAKQYDIYPFLDPQMGIDGFHQNEKRWNFTSGATVELYHLDGPEDFKGFNGQELVGLGFDEVQFIPHVAYRFLKAQCRSADPDYHAARMVRSTSNPGGEDWIIPHFHIDECPEGGRIFVHEEEIDGVKYPSTRAFIRARPRDNPKLPASYWAELKAGMNDDEQAQYIDGDYFRIAGSYFSKFIRPALHFKPSHPIPSSWEFRYAIDWGSTNPASWLLGALDPDGRLYVIDELHQPGITGRKFGEDLVNKFRNQKWCSDRVFKVGDFWGVIDKQAMDKYGSEETAASGLMEWGFRLFPAKKDRTAGCNQLKERFLMDRHGNPQVIVFEDRAPNLVRALSAIKSQAPKDPDDYDSSSSHSHSCDAARFLFMEFPVRSIREINPVDAEVARWNSLMERRRKVDSDPDRVTGGYD